MKHVHVNAQAYYLDKGLQPINRFGLSIGLCSNISIHADKRSTDIGFC